MPNRGKTIFSTLRNLKMRTKFLTVLLVTNLVACDKPLDASSQDASAKMASSPAAESAVPAVAAPADAAAPASVEIGRTHEEFASEAAEAKAMAEASALKAKTEADVDAKASVSGVYPVVDGIAVNQPALKDTNLENYAVIVPNAIKQTAQEPISTFSIDVDTGAYSNVRRILSSGQLPAKDVVRVEELINYFDYDYPLPKSTKQPFTVSTEIAPTPWNQKTKLLHIGIKGYEVPQNQLPAANLVFLIDVSGSMESPDKLELVKSALKLLSQQMSARDSIAIVVYAGNTGVLLEPTPANNLAKIHAAIDSLGAGGSTNGGAGITLAYDMAQRAFIKNGINRVILATDGDFNVGTVSFEALVNLVEEKRKTGISLTTLGVGSGNYNDKLMEQLADAGNGNHAYLDNLNEAQKVLVEQMSSTLLTIASDVKIQIEFNPEQVSEYRLIGYENRALKREDFSNDKVDAGEIGAGHSVTALYEIALKGEGGERLEAMRYADKKVKPSKNGKELAFLRLRYKTNPNENSQLLETPLLKSYISRNLEKTSNNFRFAAAVAGFGQLLRGGQYTENFSYDDVKRLAQGARGEDKFGYRAGFLNLIDLAKSLNSTKPTP
jgi:Ca-activated chloride channel family protein